MRRKIIAGNHKMNLLPQETARFVTDLLQLIPESPEPEVIVFPPFTNLTAGLAARGESHISVGAQYTDWRDQGAYTGQVSAAMIKDLGVEWVLCGHSERRTLFDESDEIVNKQIQAALRNGLKPMLCIGESLEEREKGQTKAVLEKQIQNSLKDFTAEELALLVIAYEPIWAIGTGKTATPEDANATIKDVRAMVAGLYGVEFAEKLRILYGGSVNPGNIRQLMAEPEIDGALVGGASLKAESFAELVKYNV